MIPETSVNWKAFEYKFADNPEKAFENLTYYLFCHEFNQNKGIFRYFNQPHIETDPIQDGDMLIGFQSKYYGASISMSNKETELIEAVRGAVKSYPGITVLYFYISRELSPSSKKDIVKPAYQTNIENTALKLGIKIVWRVRSHIEAQLMLDGSLTICRNVFFQTDSEVQMCCERLYKHKKDIFDHIKTDILYKDTTIILDYDGFDFNEFICSDKQVLMIDGGAGSGKSSLIKNIAVHIDKDTVFLAFRSTDLDVNDKLRFLNPYGMMTLDELLDVYREEEKRILYIDAAEKYFVFENQQTFEDIIQEFLNEDWKLIFTIRTAYNESFHNCLLNKVKVQGYHVNLLDYSRLHELADMYGFRLPGDRKLTELLCAPFYLNLYFSLDDIKNGAICDLNKTIFEERIWDDIIRNNKKRRDNLPSRREAFLRHITMDMLKNESYSYVFQSEDDYEALSELEQSGVIVPVDDGIKCSHSHDVFEELTVSHIFTDQCRKLTVENFFAGLRPSLRIRKLFRGWLADFASIGENQDFVLRVLKHEGIDSIWKDEVLLTIISTENLKDLYYQITSNMADNNCEMLKKTAFFINTCCRMAEHESLYLDKGFLWPFRLSKPSGYAWEALLGFIADKKEALPWDEELISAIIDVLDSWTKHMDHARTQNTKIAGEIGLFLFEKMSVDRNFYYLVREEQREKLLDVLVNAAWMIPEQLKGIFQIVMDGVKKKEVVVPCSLRVITRRNVVPDLYMELAERAVGDIYHYGNIPLALPETTIGLMRCLWLGSVENGGYHLTNIEEDFGLQLSSSDYNPASAGKTPIPQMLRHDWKRTTDFLIDFFNQTGDAYEQSPLNREYKECYKIVLHINRHEQEQTASDRIWQLHRGTHVGPELLTSILMGFEAWLLKIAEGMTPGVVVDYCRYVLMKSRNVMLTAVIVGVAEAYPDKMLDIVCDLLKTKELFHLDSRRCTSEGNIAFWSLGNDLFKQERRQIDELPHRKRRLEQVILDYQINYKDKSCDKFRSKIFQAIDEATRDIETWETKDKFAYYRMDIRHYQEVADVHKDEGGKEAYTLIPDYTKEMRELSRQSQETLDEYMKYTELQLWSDYKFHNDQKFEQYKKYNDPAAVCRDLRELWALLSSDNSEGDSRNVDNSLDVFKYASIVSYASAVLLRDYGMSLADEDKELCEQIILKFGNILVHASDYAFSQAGNGLPAIVSGLVLMLDSSGRTGDIDMVSFCLIVKLLIKDWGYRSSVVKEISADVWKRDRQAGRRIVYVFSRLADWYIEEIREDRSLSVEMFFEQHKDVVGRITADATFDITAIDYSALSREAMFTCIALISADTDEAVLIAEATKDIAMAAVFGDKDSARDEYRNLIGYALNYVIWLADLLLYCGEAERIKLIDSLVEKIDSDNNDNMEYLLKCLILEQELRGREKELWSVWELLKPYMLALSQKTSRFSYSTSDGPVGKDRIITAYLFANTNWREGVHRCALLSEERAGFFDDFISRAGSTNALLYAIAKLLNTVGVEPYKDKGLDWLYELIQKDPECMMALYRNTLYYLEEYIGNFVVRHRIEFRSNIVITQKTQAVLEYMVHQGSQIAFFIREQI